jgi:hypothetical protein
MPAGHGASPDALLRRPQKPDVARLKLRLEAELSEGLTQLSEP